MEFLYWLESIRNPVLDGFFSLITHLGEETLFILAGLVFFWCINKIEGYYLLAVGLTGTVINQFLKLWFRIPRPWVKDPDFTIVESARAEATGYSFPSGHTQSSVGIFGCLGRWHKTLWVRVLCIAACVLVPLSRLYLGVHTPADVGVSVLVALVLIFGLYPFMRRAAQNPKILRYILFAMFLVSLGYVLFAELYPFPADVDLENLTGGIENAYKMLGCILGFWIVLEMDERFIHFDTKAVWWAQILKLVLGLIPVLGIKALLKTPLLALFGGLPVANGVRYLLIVLFAGCVWPLTFKYFAKLGQKKS